MASVLSAVAALWQIAVVLLISMAATAPVVVIESYAMRLVPDEYIGRESAVSRFAVYSLMWTGPLLAGGLVAVAGIRGGILLLLALAVPMTISMHGRKSLRILRLPIDQVQPAVVTPRPDSQVATAVLAGVAAPESVPPAGTKVALGAQPSLTSVDMFLEDVGRAAAEHLLAAMNDAPTHGVHTVPCRLVAWESTRRGPAPRGPARGVTDLSALVGLLLDSPPDTVDAEHDGCAKPDLDEERMA